MIHEWHDDEHVVRLAGNQIVLTCGFVAIQFDDQDGLRDGPEPELETVLALEAARRRPPSAASRRRRRARKPRVSGTTEAIVADARSLELTEEPPRGRRQMRSRPGSRRLPSAARRCALSWGWLLARHSRSSCLGAGPQGRRLFEPGLRSPSLAGVTRRPFRAPAPTADSRSTAATPEWARRGYEGRIAIRSTRSPCPRSRRYFPRYSAWPRSTGDAT